MSEAATLPRRGKMRSAPVAAPRLLHLRCMSLAGFHRLAVWHWPAPGNAVPVVCVHGLTRNARDFDTLARELVKRGRSVYCPDIVGRGHSDWLRDPMQYHLGQYAADLNNVINLIGAEQVDQVGTSLGGLVGMTLAAQPGHPIRRLVLNDIGPFIPSAALRRLGRDIDAPVRHFPSLVEAQLHYRQTLAPFGALSNAEWCHLTEHSLKPAVGRPGFEVRYDPAIARTDHPWQYFNVDLWSSWRRIDCPVQVLRGADSDFISSATCQRMADSGPRARIVEVPGCGHAPTLTRPGQTAAVADFLEGGDELRAGGQAAG
ncbi:MAG: alpha/beta hydrolase [Rubrivivax sp.]|nr:alpha/beta hydrolase [Rubrivivax sp.]